MSSYNFKVVLLGQGCVGKTSLVLRYVSNVFNDSHQSTLQASFLKKQLYLEQNLVNLNIWDTAGQEKFHALGPIYYREANGALLVYDVTNPDSLRKVRDWVKELNKMLGIENIKLAIIGNKIDLLQQANEQNNQIVATKSYSQHHNQHQSAATISCQLIQEAIQFSSELLNARHYLVSAKLNQGIGDLFISLSMRMLDQARRQENARDTRRAFGSRILKTLAVTDGQLDSEGRQAGRVSIGARQASSSSLSTSSSCRC